MFTQTDVLDAYFAHCCMMPAARFGGTAEDNAVYGIEIYGDDNELDEQVTKIEQQKELDRLNRGREILKGAHIIIGHQQATDAITLVSQIAPTVIVPGSHIGTNEMYRQVTLVTDIDYVTPAEAAELTGTAESGWRNKSAGGEIPGAIKKGKQWLIPRSAVIVE